MDNSSSTSTPKSKACMLSLGDVKKEDIEDPFSFLTDPDASDISSSTLSDSTNRSGDCTGHSSALKPYLDLRISSDPYMIVKFKDMWYKTSTVKNSLNPDWNEDVTFPVYQQDLMQPVEFLLWDEDQGTRDDFMGSYRIKLKDLLAKAKDSSESNPLTFSLANPHNLKTKTKITGTISILAENNEKNSGMLKDHGHFFCEEYPMRIKAGDILLFHHSRINGMLIETFTNSSWCHAGLICEDEEGFHLIDSTTNGVCKNELYHSLRSWSNFISEITFGVVRINDLSENEKKELKQIVANFYFKHRNTKYERDISQMIKGILNANAKEDHSSLFCSELVAGCLIEAQILSTKRLSNNYMPGDFSNPKFMQKYAVKGKFDSVKFIHRKLDNLPKSCDVLKDSHKK